MTYDNILFCATHTHSAPDASLREDSPFGFTLTCGYSNSRHGYLPAAESFANKGYEVATCRYVEGTAEQIFAKQLELLNKLLTK